VSTSSRRCTSLGIFVRSVTICHNFRRNVNFDRVDCGNRCRTFWGCLSRFIAGLWYFHVEDLAMSKRQCTSLRSNPKRPVKLQPSASQPGTSQGSLQNLRSFLGSTQRWIFSFNNNKNKNREISANWHQQGNDRDSARGTSTDVNEVPTPLNHLWLDLPMLYHFLLLLRLLHDIHKATMDYLREGKMSIGYFVESSTSSLIDGIWW